MEYITKKVFRKTVPAIRRLQARYALEQGKRVSEAQIIEKAVTELEKTPVAKKKYSLMDLCGIVKGGPKANATEELDDVVYGS